MKKLINNLKNCDFVIDFDYGNTFTTVTKKSGIYLYEFVVGYEIKYGETFGFDYDSPEDCDINIEITEITGVCIYGMRNKLIEVTDQEHENLTEIIEEKLIGKKFVK